MGTGTKALICAVALVALVAGAMIGLGIADEPAPAAASDISEWDVIRPAMEPVGTAADGSRDLRRVAEGARRRPVPKRPEITDLITNAPATFRGTLVCAKGIGVG